MELNSKFLQKEKIKQERKEFKSKISEFLKKYFTYYQSDNQISVEIKQELKELGAFKPFYAESEDSRAILLINLWPSDNQEVKNIVRQAAQKHFSMESDKVDDFLNNIFEGLLKKREIAKRMRSGGK